MSLWQRAADIPAIEAPQYQLACLTNSRRHVGLMTTRPTALPYRERPIELGLVQKLQCSQCMFRLTNSKNSQFPPGKNSCKISCLEMKIEDHNFNTDHEIKPRLAACDSTARPVETGLSNGFHQIRLISAYDPPCFNPAGGLGSAVSSPSWIWGEAPAANYSGIFRGRRNNAASTYRTLYTE